MKAIALFVASAIPLGASLVLGHYAVTQHDLVFAAGTSACGLAALGFIFTGIKSL